MKTLPKDFTDIYTIDPTHGYDVKALEINGVIIKDEFSFTFHNVSTHTFIHFIYLN